MPAISTTTTTSASVSYTSTDGSIRGDPKRGDPGGPRTCRQACSLRSRMRAKSEKMSAACFVMTAASPSFARHLHDHLHFHGDIERQFRHADGAAGVGASITEQR